MIEIKRERCHPLRMAHNVPDEIVNSGMLVISNDVIYEYIGIGWIEVRKAERDDYNNIPVLID